MNNCIRCNRSIDGINVVEFINYKGDYICKECADKLILKLHKKEYSRYIPWKNM